MSKIDSLIKQFCPNGVEFKELGEIGKLFGGLTGKSKKDFENGNARFVSYVNIFNNIAVDQSRDDFVFIKENEKQRKLKLGDVLITGSSETPDECGMSSVIDSEPTEPLYLNSFCFAFRLNDTNILAPGFSKYLFRDSAIRKQIIKTASGVTRFNISKKRFEKILIPIPPLEVQKEILSILDKFTQLEAELEAELEARRKQYEYYRNQLLTFDESRERVRWFTLGDIGKVSMCKRIFKDQTSAVGDIPFYKIGTFGKSPDSYISRKVYDEYKSKYSFPKKGDLLISASGTIGRTVVYDGEDAYFQDSNIIWLDNDEKIVTNKYLFHVYKIVKWQTEGGTIQRLYNDNFKKIKIAVPSLDEQNQIVTVLDKFERLVNGISEGLPAELNARRQQYEYYRTKLLTFQEAVA